MAISNVVRFSIRKLAKKRAKRRKKTKFSPLKKDVEEKFKEIEHRKKTIKSYDDLIKTKAHNKSNYEHWKKLAKRDKDEATYALHNYLRRAIHTDRRGRAELLKNQIANKAYKENTRRARKKAKELAKRRAEEGYGKLLKFGKKKK